MPPIPGFNTRETSLAAWLVAFFVFALTKSEGRKSMGSALGVIFCSIVTPMLALAAAYVASTLLLLRRFGYQGDHMAKTATLWFIGIGLIALFNTEPATDAYFRRLVLRNVALVVIVEFIVNLHTFPLLVELLLVPLASALALTQVVTENKPELAQERKLIAWCLTALGLTSLSFSLAYLVADFNSVATVEKIGEFLLPLILTVCFLPLLYTARMVIVYQGMLSMIRFGLRENEALYRFARRLIVRACGLSLGRAQLFEAEFRGRLWAGVDEAEVTRVVDEFRQAWRRGARASLQAK